MTTEKDESIKCILEIFNHISQEDRKIIDYLDKEIDKLRSELKVWVYGNFQTLE